MAGPRSLTCLIGLAAALVCAAPAAAYTSPAHQLSARGHGVTVKARVFTYCQTLTDAQGKGVGMCADGVPSATPRRVPVHPRGSVAITLGAAATTVSARYATADGSAFGSALRVTPVGRGRRHFAISLPALRPGALLIVSTRYRDVPTADRRTDSGDAHFSVGLRRHRHAPVKPR